MKYKYQVALSFAGEDRSFAEAVATGLRSNETVVFYDNFYVERLWGEELPVKLGEIYSDESQYCIMILSRYYLEKMWPHVERQNAIQRQIELKGQAYILPVRLDGFADAVPGLPTTIGHLSVTSSQPGVVVDTFLKKIGRAKLEDVEQILKGKRLPSYIPKIRKAFTDKDKNQFLKSAFEQIISSLYHFAAETHNHYPQIEYEIDKITSRKVLFTIYDRGKQVTQFKIWIGGLMASDSIAFAYGNHVDTENDGSMNESMSLDDRDGELKLKPMGIGMFGVERDKPMSPKDAAEYLWKMVCRYFS